MAAPFTEFADALGGAKATNMVMLGALVESGHLLFDSEVTDVSRKTGAEPALAGDRLRRSRTRP